MKAKILAIEKLSETSAQGYADLRGEYVHFLVEGESVKIEARFPKDDYKNYAFFAAVMGKWDPHASFFVRPTYLKKFDAKSIMRAAKRRG